MGSLEVSIYIEKLALNTEIYSCKVPCQLEFYFYKNFGGFVRLRISKTKLRYCEGRKMFSLEFYS